MDVGGLDSDSPSATTDSVETSVEWNRFPTRFVFRRVISACLSATLFGFPILAGLGWVAGWSYSIEQDFMIRIVVGCWLLLLLARVVGISLVVPKRCFVLRSLDFTLRTGWLGREELIIPFSRVQEVEIRCRILDRLFRLNSLVLKQPRESEVVNGLDPYVCSILRDYLARRILEITKLGGRDSIAVTELTEKCSHVDGTPCQDNEVIGLHALQQSAEPSWRPFGHVGREVFGRLGSLLVLALLAFWIGTGLYALFWKDTSSLTLTMILAWAFFSVRTLVYPALEVPRRGYALQESEILIKRGLIATSRLTIPFERIQDVSSSRGFIDRRFGLSTLHISAASSGKVSGGFISIGSSGPSTSLEGIGLDEAEDLRLQILERVSNIRDAKKVSKTTTKDDLQPE